MFGSTIEQIRASKNFVVVHSIITGTHKGNVAGIAATNKSVKVHACNLVEQQPSLDVFDFANRKLHDSI